MHGSQMAAVISKGWMSFDVAAGGVVRLGGANQTVPDRQLSVGNFLATGIPQNSDKTRFAEPASQFGDGANGHSIKHMRFTLVSVAVAATPGGRFATSGATPTATLGAQVLTGDGQTIPNSRDEIFRFVFFNNSAGAAVFEVEVWE